MSAATPATGLARTLLLGQAALAARAAGDAGMPRPQRELLETLLRLRGAAAKVAQFLSLESDMLPDPLARELARACQRTPSLDGPYVLQAVRRSIGPLREHFASFDPVPFAAASIGQVHAATTLAGEAVAVKVQYPGMRETVRSDLRLLRHAARLVDRRGEHGPVFDEIDARLLEECDYAQEAAGTAWFGEHLALEGVRIPRVHPAHCGEGVLTTERMDGLHLHDWLAANPSQRERDLAAQRLFDVFVRSLHGLRRLHADPHPGNVLFAPGARIVLLDFGCTRWIPDAFHRVFCRLVRAMAADDGGAVQAVYGDMGLFQGLEEAQASRLAREVLEPFRAWVSVPLRTPVHDFGADPAFVAEGRRRFVALLRQGALAGLRPEFVLVNRTLYGLYRLFEQMGARVRCQALWAAA